MNADPPGQIVILNGVQRSGKTSIAHVMQETFPGVWMNIGVDAHIKCTPPALRPGVGLRAQKPEWASPTAGRVPVEVLEGSLPVLYAALYESIAAHARLGLNVVVDVGRSRYLMPSIPGISHQRAVGALRQVGFEVVREGKHIVMSDGRRIWTIPRANPINAFTMGGIARDAGLKVDGFRELL